MAMDAAQLQQLLGAVRGGGGKKLQSLSSTNGADWQTWKTHYRTVGAINNWNDLRRRRELKAAMLDEAARLTQDIDVEPPGPVLYTYENALTAYEERFLPAAAGRVARCEFHQAQQRPDETVAQFHGRLRESYSRAYPNDVNPNTSTLLIQTYALGLADALVAQYVLDQDPQTYADASNAAQMKSATETAMRNRPGAGKSGGVNNLAGTAGGVNAQANRGDIECWNCGKRGHIRAECRSSGQGGQGRGRGRGGRRGGRGRGNYRGGQRRVNELGSDTPDSSSTTEQEDATMASKNA